MIYIQQLKKLRNNLANNRVSVMVGAGFSKNVSPKFLAWNELLHDLCYELYKEEIDTEYYTAINTSIHRRKTRSQFIQQKVGKIISQVGYLSIVTRYIERKGYNESIANYIEDRIPDVEIREGKLYMTVGKETEALSLQKLDLHKELLALPWNNIYTTNYDRLLEICVNPDLYDQFVKERKKLEDAIVLLNNQELQCQNEIKELKAEQESAPSFENRMDPIEKLYPEISFPTEDDAAKRKGELEAKIDNLKRKVRENEKLIQYKEAALNDCFTVVKNSSELRIKRNKNIIKLHGSLRTKDDRENKLFGFDGDASTHYIIAKEHYDTYPKKHEAYTQLMRISLLQESFCLIGFSGIDPNFLAWIGWIRDLLFKYVSERGRSEDFKIFLIDVGDPAKEEKELFFRNHSIIRIPLLESDIIQFLEAETGMKLDAQNEKSAALKMFFQFLSNHEDVTSNAPVLDLSHRERHRGIWNGMMLHDFNKAIPPQILESAVKQLKEIEAQIVVGDTHYGYNHNQHFLIGAAEQLLSNQLKEFPNSIEAFLELLLYAVEAENVPIKYVLTKRVIDVLLNCSSTAARTRVLIERNASLNPLSIGENDNADSQSYDFILRRAFQFQFDQLKDALEKWQPTVEHLHLKAGFYALFNQDEAEELLMKQLDEGEDLMGEQRLFSMELLSFIKQSNFKLHKLRVDKKLNRTIRQYEQAGFERLTQHLEYYQEQLQPKFPKPLPYGKNRYSVSSTISFKVHGHEETALQYLMLLVKSGFQVCLDPVNSIPSEKWYPIFSKAFEDYPLPFIFYSLQHSGEDFLKRVGQDVAYSDKLDRKLPAICEMLLTGYWSAPKFIQENILSFLSRLFIATAPEVWQDGFLRIWKSFNAREAFDDRFADGRNFMTEGIKYISNQTILYDIIEDLLRYVDRYSNQVIDYLFVLNSNRYLKKTVKEDIPPSLVQILNRRIEELPKNPQTNMFILGNLHGLLSADQIAVIEFQLNNVDFFSVQNERIWHVFLYFANGKKELTDKIKSAIVAHPLLWFTGIKGNKIERGLHGFLSLAAVTKYNKKHDSKGIVWEKEEVMQIYERMKGSLVDIEGVVKKDSGIISFGFELEEMKLFMDNFRTRLEDAPDFKLIYEKTSSLYNKEREYTSLDEGLTSQDNKKIVWALSELSKNIELGNRSEDLLLIVLNRILFQMSVSLEACLAYVSRWLEDKNNELLFRNCIAILEQILLKFCTHPAEEVDVAFVEEKLVRVAFRLNSLGSEQEVVKWWINKAHASRYNNVKQFLLKESVTNLTVG